MKKIGVIFGGKSGEHEVSLLSAVSVIEAFNKEKFSIVKIGITKKGKWMLYEGENSSIADGSWEKTAVPFAMSSLPEVCDFVFPVLHGPYGEDGTVQGLLELLDMPYAGCGVLASSLCMDKATAKQIFEREGIPTAAYKLVYSEDVKADIDKVLDDIEEEIVYPMFIKPSNMGSSVGISKADNREELAAGLIEAGHFDRRILIEEGINCREIETGVIGNHDVEVAAVGEIVSGDEFYDYDAKYNDNSGTVLSIPADLDEEDYQRVRELAEKAYRAMDCSGFSRVDFFKDKDTGLIYINEINTIPGFTKYSMFPTLWKEAGVPRDKLVERIVELGYERYNSKNNR